MTAINLRNEINAALKQGASRDNLLAIVLRHKQRGVSQQATYDTLQSICADLNCNADEANPHCETLEDVMDRVWGFCAAQDAIWDSSLAETRED